MLLVLAAALVAIQLSAQSNYPSSYNNGNYQSYPSDQNYNGSYNGNYDRQGYSNDPYVAQDYSRNGGLFRRRDDYGYDNMRTPSAMEYEIAFGLGTSGKANHAGRFLVEARYNIQWSPIDIALQYTMMTAELKDPNSFNFEGGPFNNGNFNYNGMLGVFIDFNGWGGGGYSTIYAGMGIGYYLGKFVLAPEGSSKKVREGDNGVFLAPRAGVELFEHLRIGVEYRYCFKEAPSTIGFTIGWAFGGQTLPRY